MLMKLETARLLQRLLKSLVAQVMRHLIGHEAQQQAGKREPTTGDRQHAAANTQHRVSSQQRSASQHQDDLDVLGHVQVILRQQETGAADRCQQRP